MAVHFLSPAKYYNIESLYLLGN